MMKKVCLLISCFILLTLVGCTRKNESKPNLNVQTSVETDDFKENWYISMTTTPGATETLYIKNSVYDFKNDKLIIHDQIERTSQYGLGVYDASSDCIYYSDKDKIKGGDQLCVYNNTTKERKQLTEDLFAINYIIPRKDDILLAAVKGPLRSIGLYSYNKESNKLERVKFPSEDEENISAWLMNYNPSNEEIIIQAYNDNERAQITEKWNNKKHTSEEADKDPLIIPMYFYSYKNDILTYLFKEDMIQGSGLVANKNKVIYKLSDKEHRGVICIYDRNTKTKKMIKDPRLGGFIYLSDDGKRLYGIYDGVKCLDLDSNAFVECTGFNGGGYINNGILLKKY